MSGRGQGGERRPGAGKARLKDLPFPLIGIPGIANVFGVLVVGAVIQFLLFALLFLDFFPELFEFSFLISCFSGQPAFFAVETSAFCSFSCFFLRGKTRFRRTPVFIGFFPDLACIERIVVERGHVRNIVSRSVLN